MSTSFFPAAALVLVLVVGACATTGSHLDGDIETRSGFATLVIENDNPSTVTVYALRNGSRQRIGTVTGLSSQQFTIRRNMLGTDGELRVGVDPVGSSRLYTAQPILVTEGDTIELTVSSFLR